MSRDISDRWPSADDARVIGGPVTELVDDGERVLADGGRPGPDPENLSNADRPAVVDVEDDGDVYVASARVRDTGWLWLKQWDGQTFKLPPHRVQAIQLIQKERYGEADSEGLKPQRIADEGWRERAKAMTGETADADGAAEAVVADD